jgi:RNA polymerase sigma factor (sigma-70 family)
MRSDRELVDALRAREPGAFEELYGRYRGQIWRFLARLTGGGSSAEDLFQETWLAAARNAHLLREGTEPLRWLYTIAHNKHRNALRSWAFESRRGAELCAHAPPAPLRPDDAAAAQLEVERALIALARLPEAYREVLVLCACEGLDSNGAAAVLDLKPEAVRKRLSRARAELAALVGRDHDGEGADR